MTEGTKSGISTVCLSELEGNWRVDAEYYQPHYLAAAEKLQNCGLLSELIECALHPTEIRREYSEAGLQLLLAQNVRRNHLDFSTTVFMPEVMAGLLRKNRLQPGDVVMVRTGANFGDTACYDGAPESLFASAHLILIRPKEIEGAYLSTYFNSKIGRQLIKRGMYGSSQPEIAPAYVETLPVPRSNTVEHEVEELVNQAREARRESKRRYCQAEHLLLDELGLSDLELPAGLYNDAPISKVWRAHRIDAEYYQPRFEFLDRAIQSASATVKPLGSLIYPIINGFNWRDFVEDGTPYIRVGDVYKDWVDLDSASRVAISPEEVGKPVGLQVGDILFTRKGTFGQAAVVDNRTSSALISSEIMRLRLLDPSVIHPQYLSLYLNSVLGYTQVERRVHGAGFYSISQEDLGQVLICAPGWKAQKKIAGEVTKSHAARHRAESLLEQAKHEVEALIESEAAYG